MGKSNRFPWWDEQTSIYDCGPYHNFRSRATKNELFVLFCTQSTYTNSEIYIQPAGEQWMPIVQFVHFPDSISHQIYFLAFLVKLLTFKRFINSSFVNLSCKSFAPAFLLRPPSLLLRGMMSNEALPTRNAESPPMQFTELSYTAKSRTAGQTPSTVDSKNTGNSRHMNVVARTDHNNIWTPWSVEMLSCGVRSADWIPNGTGNNMGVAWVPDLYHSVSRGGARWQRSGTQANVRADYLINRRVCDVIKRCALFGANWERVYHLLRYLAV